MRKKMLLIYNPHAGTGKIKEWLSDMVEAFTLAGYDILVRPTVKNKDTSLVVKEYLEKENFDKVVCSGGDGTLNRVVNGVILSGKQLDIGYIPAGTTNDFAYNLGISKSPKQAVKIAIGGVPFTCDAGLINGTYFTYVAAFGIFTDASYKTHQTTKNLLGRVAYVLEGIKGIPANLKPYKLELICDGKKISGEFILGMVTNSESVGGFKGITGKEVLLDDGYFEGIFVRMPKTIVEFQGIINSLLVGDLKSDLIVSLPVERLEIISHEPIPWTIDGDFGGEFKHSEISVKKQAFNIMCGIC